MGGSFLLFQYDSLPFGSQIKAHAFYLVSLRPLQNQGIGMVEVDKLDFPFLSSWKRGK